MVRHAKRPHRRYRRRRRGNRKVATVGTVKRMFARKVETKQTALYPGDLAMANRYVCVIDRSIILPREPMPTNDLVHPFQM